MCFGGSSPKRAETPAPAPAAPSPIAEETALGDVRKAEDKALFGSSAPSLRVDRSATSGGVGADGAGLRM
jgi:hypothetical protein